MSSAPRSSMPAHAGVQLLLRSMRPRYRGYDAMPPALARLLRDDSGNCQVEPDRVVWNIEAWTRSAHIAIAFTCPRSTMFNVNYENPDGEKRHNHLWNGGWAPGTVQLYRRSGGTEELVDAFKGELGGCEYGEEDPRA